MRRARHCRRGVAGDRTLQDRVLDSFSQTLAPRGFLCLGPKETLWHSEAGANYEVVSRKQRVFRKQLPLNVLRVGGVQQ